MNMATKFTLVNLLETVIKDTQINSLHLRMTVSLLCSHLSEMTKKPVMTKNLRHYQMKLNQLLLLLTETIS